MDYGGYNWELLSVSAKIDYSLSVNKSSSNWDFKYPVFF